VNATLPQDVLNSHRPNGFFFLFCKDTKKLRVIVQFGKYRITNLWVQNELCEAAGVVDDGVDSLSSDNSGDIEIRDNLPYLQAQFNFDSFIGDSHVRCRVLESNNNNYYVAQFFNFRRDFVRDRMIDNY
jgi:hypothetical protein